MTLTTIPCFLFSCNLQAPTLWFQTPMVETVPPAPLYCLVCLVTSSPRLNPKVIIFLVQGFFLFLGAIWSLASSLLSFIFFLVLPSPLCRCVSLITFQRPPLLRSKVIFLAPPVVNSCLAPVALPHCTLLSHYWVRPVENGILRHGNVAAPPLGPNLFFSIAPSPALFPSSRSPSFHALTLLRSSPQIRSDCGRADLSFTRVLCKFHTAVQWLFVCHFFFMCFIIGWGIWCALVICDCCHINALANQIFTQRLLFALRPSCEKRNTLVILVREAFFLVTNILQLSLEYCSPRLYKHIYLILFDFFYRAAPPNPLEWVAKYSVYYFSTIIMKPLTPGGRFDIPPTLSSVFLRWISVFNLFFPSVSMRVCISLSK